MKKLVSLLLALCLVCGVMTALADGMEWQEVQIAGVTCRIPAELAITDQGNITLDAACEAYELSVLTMDLTDEDPENLDLTDGSIQTDNMFLFLYLMLQDPDVAMQATNMCMEEEIGLLSGKKVKHGTIGDGIAMCAHRYRNTGVMVFASTEGGIEIYDLLSICDEVVRSMRYDGVSEDDMIADAQVDYVVITADSGKIRSEASVSGGLIKTAYKGEAFELVEETADWYVVMVDGRTGYIHKGVAAIQ